MSSGHLSGPDEKAIYKKLNKLGHIKNNHIAGFSQQMPRDNRMYNIGCGELNLQKMDKHLRKKSGGKGLGNFSSTILNENAFQKAKRGRLRKESPKALQSSKISTVASSEMSCPVTPYTPSLAMKKLVSQKTHMMSTMQGNTDERDPLAETETDI